jgi:methenyltetrahydromethanopterin cyclohydrolase
VSEDLQLNARAAQLVERIAAETETLRISVTTGPGGCQLLDLGIGAPGGLAAGLRLAEVCLAGLGQVSLVPCNAELAAPCAVQIATDHPVAACMASQYAGWQLAAGKYFAMGSGPMRALARKEPLFERLTYRESSSVAVGVLETRKLPPEEICHRIAADTGVPLPDLKLLAAPTASHAGNLQVVARSVETALHKLFELGFDLTQIESAIGRAPLPPMAAHDLAAIGRTNDAILYGAEVTLWVRSDDDLLNDIGPRVPSCASPEHGAPFAEIFARYDHDFYRIDPHLFSPAVVSLVNCTTGRTFRFGQMAPDVLARSFIG